MKPCKIQVLVRVQEFTAATEEVEDKKKIMQNFNLQLSVRNSNKIVIYIHRSQGLDKARKIAETRIALIIEQKK